MSKLAAAVLFALTLCLSQVSAQLPQTVLVSDEEQKVFQAVLADFSANDLKERPSSKTRRTLVVFKRTVGDRWLRSDDELSKTIQSLLKVAATSTIKAYLENKREVANLRDSFDLKTPYTFFSQEDSSAMFGNGRYGWPDFRKRYPDSDGLINFSRVGFDRINQQALVYMEHACGSECGTGFYILLNKANGQWRVADKRIAGMS